MDLHSMQQVDAFIVGGGLAGIHLALAMDREGLVPLVINRPDPYSSSRIAAGIINPITGRRFALTWLYDHLEPVFKEVYQYWEDQWDTLFFEAKDIFRSVPENKLVNDLDAKLIEPAYEKYCRKMTEEEIKVNNAVIHFKPPGYVMKGYQVDTNQFLDQAIKYLKSKGMYREGEFSSSPNQLEQDKFTFEQYRSDKLIWSTGASIAHHPDFSWVKMNPNKGEILHLMPSEGHLENIIKQSAFFVPLNPETIWVGSFNSWEFEDSRPTEDGLDYLKSRAQILKQPFTITSHLAAIRPAVEDRRPVIGSHPKNPNIYLFNGFGSKGTSLIPYFAKNLVEHMTNGSEIPPEANMIRFYE